jgi:hypothetical protein
MFNSTPDANSKEHEILRQEMQEIRRNLQNLAKTLEIQCLPTNVEQSKPNADTPARKNSV